MKETELITFKVRADRKKVYDSAAKYMKTDKSKICREALEELVRRAKDRGFTEGDNSP